MVKTERMEKDLARMEEEVEVENVSSKRKPSRRTTSRLGQLALKKESHSSAASLKK